MKTIKFFLLAMVAIVFSTSCNKNSTIGGGVTLQVGPALITLTWGNTGGSGYYYGGLPSYGSEFFVGYISARPTDQNKIPICTSNGIPFCTASCTSTWWPQANDFYMIARSVTYPPLRPVLVRVQWNTTTNAPNDFYIVGY